MAWPITFNSLTNPQPLSDFDVMFNAVAGVISIPSIASGTNNISLTPVTNSPALPGYVELCGARFRATGTTTGLVTAQINGLGFLPVYHADGVTQASTGDLVLGSQYVVTYSAALQGGLGGFFLESPSLPVAAQPWFLPGGRLTLQSGVPVMTTTQNGLIVYYAPYVHPFVPIYNGNNIQMYNFTSGLSDQIGLTLTMNGNGNWPIGMYDVFAILSGAVPVLATYPWTNTTTRGLTLSVFGGFLTNSGNATMRTGQSTTQVAIANQATYLGSFYAFAAGNTTFTYPGAASGGLSGAFYLDNYYNKCRFTGQCVDTGTSYTYSSATVRQARGSTGNAIAFVQGSSEKAVDITNWTRDSILANATLSTGIGLDSTTTFVTYKLFSSSVAIGEAEQSSIMFSATGLHTVNALEQGDGTNANTFDASSANFLEAGIWL